MRYVMAIILAAFIAAPAFAQTPLCEMDGPHNCVEINEDQLIASTKDTIHDMQLTHEQHAFRTQNDDVLAAMATQHAHLKSTGSVQGTASWRK